MRIRSSHRTLALAAAWASTAACSIPAAVHSVRSAGMSTDIGGRLTSQVLRIDDVERTYTTFRPLGIDGEALPLVIVLHGSGSDGEAIRRLSRMDSVAAARRFIVAFPNGVAGAFGFHSDWNAGTCCGTASARHTDDVAFLTALIDSLTHHGADPQRIYIAGFSDGGRMAYRAACELSDRVAAVGVVSGSVVTTRCDPAVPVPIIAFHGTADRDVALMERAPGFPREASREDGEPPSIAPAAQLWADRDRCTARSLTSDGASTARWIFSGCAEGARVEFYSIRGGGHAWPGGLQDGSGDRPSPDVAASARMIDFFFGYARRSDRRLVDASGAEIATLARR